MAFPDRLARQRPGSGSSYKLASGRGASLAPHDPLSVASYLVIADLDAGQRDGRVFLAAPLTRQEVFAVFADALVQEDEVVWDEKTGAVTARRLSRLDALVVEERPLPQPEPEAVRAALLAAIRRPVWTSCRGATKARAFQERVQCLALWQPGEKWPDLSDAHLFRVPLPSGLGRTSPGCGAGSSLRSLYGRILRGQLDWRQQQRLDREAPTHIQVPSGSKVRLRYAAGEPPVLAVRLQEMFGLADTPTVCGGTVPVTLHLLSPAQRPTPGHLRSARLLGRRLPPGEKGDEGPLSQTPLAGQPLAGRTHCPGQAGKIICRRPGKGLE